MSDFSLDRELSIENDVDATGKKWVIHMNRQNGLCYVRPEPDRSDAVIPDELQGLWTKPSLLVPKLKDYLNASWNHAEAAKQKADRKAQAAKEAAKKAKAKVADDAGSSDE